MPSLRKLLGAAIVSGDYDAFFEALVEAVELQDTPTAATFRKLRVERLALRVERDGLDRRCSELEYELAEVQAEILGQAKRLDRRLDKLYAENGNLQISLNKAKAEIERLRPLAENWQLLLGMRQGGTLTHTTDAVDRPDWVAHWDGAGGTIIISSGSDDPAEALRAIQKEKENRNGV